MMTTSTRGALLGIHAQTALHPGAGTALGTVDLPIQRERHTHWPMIAGSALKGLLRDACREQLVRAKKASDRKAANAHDTLTGVFGPETAHAGDFAGALSVTDARLLAFPVRSLKGVFALVTCPQALERLARDAALAGWVKPFELPKVAVESERLLAPAGCPCVLKDSDNKERVVLEEFDFQKTAPLEKSLVHWLTETLLPMAEHYASTRQSLKSRLLVLADDDFTHFARHATEVTARIGLDYESKTVKDGALFYQEFLPAETLLYAVVLAHPSRKDGGGDAAAVLKTVADSLPPVLQIGGDETTGKGLCAVRLAEANNPTGGAQ